MNYSYKSRLKTKRMEYNMKPENFIVFGAALFCVLIFEAIAVWCFKSKKPVNFWSGEKIPESSISDIKKYNHANGIMWLIYGLLWLTTSFVGLYNALIAGICIGICCACVIILIIIYSRIRNKYQKEY